MRRYNKKYMVYGGFIRFDTKVEREFVTIDKFNLLFWNI